MALQAFTRFDPDAHVLPEQRVMNPEVVQARLNFDLSGFAEQQSDSPVAIETHEDLSVAAIGGIVPDKRDKRTEIVGRRDFCRCRCRSAGCPRSGCDGHVHRVTRIRHSRPDRQGTVNSSVIWPMNAAPRPRVYNLIQGEANERRCQTEADRGPQPRS